MDEEDDGMDESGQQRKQVRARLLLRETRYGTWVVQDDGGHRGGCFFTQEAARKFISHEFGAEALVLITHQVVRQAA
jgi:hypothetical protein